jgi:hypothetical protein
MTAVVITDKTKIQILVREHIADLLREQAEKYHTSVSKTAAGYIEMGMVLDGLLPQKSTLPKEL